MIVCPFSFDHCIVYPFSFDHCIVYPFSFDHCIVYPFSIQNSDYPFCIFNFILLFNQNLLWYVCVVVCRFPSVDYTVDTVFYFTIT